MAAPGGRPITDRLIVVGRRIGALWPGERGPTYMLSRWVFQRALGLTYLIAFLSLALQIEGLIGSGGILPAAEFLDGARRTHGTQAYRLLPTLAWLSADDLTLSALCWIGAGFSILLILGLAPLPILAALWALYLSLTVAGQLFLNFQWDALLLETGLLAILYAPTGWRPTLATEPRPSPVARWLLWWLLFRLMFLSGITKLVSGDPTWADFTALTHHFETQPLPTWIAWHAYGLPHDALRAAVGAMYAFELLVPLLILSPAGWRTPRRLACALLVLFQAGIAITGNYGFFNLLTIVLCVTLLEDDAMAAMLPDGTTRRVRDAPVRHREHRLKRLVVAAAAIVIVPLSALAFAREIAASRPGADPAAITPRWAAGALEWAAPFRSINGYGLFRVMTTERPEIQILGSRDGLTWIEYDFRWKPDAIGERPRFVAPHMPRLDWQMWFAALGPRAHQGLLLALTQRLLEGSDDVVGLFDRDPFAGTPPRYVRLVYWRYRFATPEEQRQSGVWWMRERLGDLTPPLTLDGGRLRAVTPAAPDGR